MATVQTFKSYLTLIYLNYSLNSHCINQSYPGDTDPLIDDGERDRDRDTGGNIDVEREGRE